MLYRLIQTLRKAIAQQLQRLMRRPPTPVILRTETSFGQIKAEETVGWLRELATELVTALLQQTEPRLEPLFQSLQAKAIISAEVRRQVDFKRNLERSLNHEQSSETWRDATIRGFEDRLEMHNGYAIPDAMWETLFLRAWGDGQFIHKIAYQVEAAVAQRVYYDVNPPPKIAFSVAAYCWLLAVAPIRTSLFRLEITEHDKVVHAIQDRCKVVALAALPLTDPWDQWLVLQAERYWSVNTWDRALRDAIRQLPLTALQDEEGSSDNLPVWFKNVI